MKQYTIEELKIAPDTLTTFLLRKLDKNELILDENLINEAILYYKKNSKTKYSKSPSRIKRLLFKKAVVFNNALNNK